MGFRGFPDEALIFYEGLEADNSKAYWGAHKHLYDSAVKEPMLALLDELAGEFGQAHMFRPYRDVRFAKDKSPYKTHQGAYVRADVEGIGFYVQIGADGLYAGGGWWAQGEQINRFRDALGDDAAGGELEKLVESLRGEYKLGGDRLKTRPRGFPEDHPRLELLKHKSLHFGRHYEPQEWLHTAEAADRVRADWRAVRPLVDWCRVHLV